MLIKPLLILSIGAILIYFLGHRNAMSFRAGKRILLVLFVAAAISSIVDPGALNTLAHAVGIGRGADLLLYGLILAFVFVSLNIYLKFKDLSARHAQVVRKLALLERRLDKIGERP